jgi:hypothetical protein
MAWELTGNSGTNPASNFLGTVEETNPQPLVIKTNGVERIRIASDGKLSIIAPTLSASGDVIWGNNSLLWRDQGGSIELGGNNSTAGTGTPYIDFHYEGLAQDYNTRIINDADGRLSIIASTLSVSGDIVLQNADCAEEFDIASAEEAEPGTVMVLDESGHLRPSSEPYDKKVAGVVSGGGDLKPGLILDNQPGKNNRLPIALLGKTCCKVDTRYSPIEVGDLLTTSSTPGHAMKATDPVRAFGSIIGKALHSLNSGTGMIPILIALQ